MIIKAQFSLVSGLSFSSEQRQRPVSYRFRLLHQKCLWALLGTVHSLPRGPDRQAPSDLRSPWAIQPICWGVCCQGRLEVAAVTLCDKQPFRLLAGTSLSFLASRKSPKA